MKFPSLKKKKDIKLARPTYVNMKPRRDNSSILAQAKKRKQKQVFQEGARVFAPKLGNYPIKKILVITILIAIAVGLLLFLRSTTAFNVTTVEVITDKSENYAVVKSIGDSYIGKNSLLVSAREIENAIKNKINSVDTVFVNKTLTGKIKIEVIENTPVYYQANNTGIYLIDQSGEVMKIIEPIVKLSFSETEILVKENKLPIESDQVRVKYLERFSEEDRSAVIWKDVPKEEKEGVLNQMKQDIENKINDFSNKLTEQLKDDQFKNLIGSYIPNSESYKVGELVSLDRLNFVSIVLDFFKSKNLVSTKVVWDSSYTLEVFLQDNPSVLFSVKRSYTLQFDDLNTLIYHGQFNGAKVVDVRSSNYSVVR